MILPPFKMAFYWLCDEALQGCVEILQCVCDHHARVRLRQITQMALRFLSLQFLTVAMGMRGRIETLGANSH